MNSFFAGLMHELGRHLFAKPSQNFKYLRVAALIIHTTTSWSGRSWMENVIHSLDPVRLHSLDLRWLQHGAEPGLPTLLGPAFLCWWTERLFQSSMKLVLIRNASCLFASVPGLKPGGSPSVGWGGSVCSHFPTLVHTSCHTCIGVLCHLPWLQLHSNFAAWTWPVDR